MLGGATGAAGSVGGLLDLGGLGGSGVLNLAGTLAFTGTSSTSSFVIGRNGVLNLGNATTGAATAGTITGLTSIDNAGVINFNQSDSVYTFDTAITGTGQLIHNAAGMTTLTGANSYSGGTTINGGTLVAANASALGTGNVTVGTGAALEVTSGTTLAVGGNLDFQTGSTYRVQANSAALTSSKINVQGKATLAGNVVHVGPESNAATDFQVGQTYTILHANQISGTFSAATSNYAYLDAALDYLQSNGTTTDVTLKLQRKSNGNGNGNGPMVFAELANTGNQAAVANGIESLGRDNPLFNYIETLPTGAPAAAFNSLAGDTHASVGGSLPGTSALAPSVSQQHLRSNMSAGMRAGAPVAQSDGPLPASAWPSSKALPAWAEVVGHWQTYNGDSNAARLKQTITGLFVGMDEEVGHSGWRLGGSLGFTHADGRVADRNSTSKVNSYSAAVYGGKSFGTGMGPRTNVLGGLAYTWHDIATTRNITSLGQTLQADYSAHTGQLFAEVGYAIGQYDKFGFEPFAGVSLGQQRSGSFQERGGFAALQGRSSTDDIANTTLGVRMHSDFQLAGKEARVRATVGWRHAFGDVATRKTMAFEGGQNFTVAGAPLARNTALLGLEGEVTLSRTAALVLGYRGELASGQRDHAASVKLRWAF
jgi:outer membrane autotransporter protein